MADELLCVLLSASKKASRIARLCRENKSIFSLLIQEKGQKNNEIDFKTLADVFIQQLVTKDLKVKFGDLADRVKGEETNQFTNALGETVVVEIGDCIEETEKMLMKVLDGNKNVSRILSEAAHTGEQDEYTEFVANDVLQELSASSLDLSRIGIWIDPIDCTSQYVKGIEDSVPLESGVFESGLQCVMVLIGVYCLDTGWPVMGVVNQPFVEYNSSGKRWEERCVWGYSYGKVKKSNLFPADKAHTMIEKKKPVVVISLHDPKARSVMDHLSQNMDTCMSRGAGYKIATVFDQLTEVFLYTSKGSFKWDTCGPHAILLSCGGGIADLEKAVKYIDHHKSGDDLFLALQSCQVQYQVSDSTKANEGGLLVYNGSHNSQVSAKKVLETCTIVD